MTTATETWVSIVGTRPQFVKLGPICRAIEVHNRLRRALRIRHCIVHTGQHYDYEIAALLFTELQLPTPDYNLGVGSGSPAVQIGKMMERIEFVLQSEKPDWLINYGDTNSTLAGALVGVRLECKLAHVEAGCRSWDVRMPEEQARLLTDHLSDLLLTPSAVATENLRREGIGTEADPRKRRVVMTGDVMYDAFLQNRELAISAASRTLRELGLSERSYYLLTIHRAENTNCADRLRALLDAVESLDLPVLFPVHPRTAAALSNAKIQLNGRILSTAPLGYLEMLAVEKHARAVLTDSGGVQKEAFYLGVPCITLRDTTEWPETVDLGANQLVGGSLENLRTAISRCRDSRGWPNPYGEGTAAQKIVREILLSGAAVTDHSSVLQ